MAVDFTDEFDTPLTVLLGYFSSDILSVGERADEMGRDNETKRFISAMRAVIEFVENMAPNSVGFWKMSLCKILYSLISTEPNTGPENSIASPSFGNMNCFEHHFTVVSYMRDFLPELQFDNFIEICFQLSALGEVGNLLFDKGEILESICFKLFRESNSDRLENNTDVTQLIYNAWKCQYGHVLEFNGFSQNFWDILSDDQNLIDKMGNGFEKLLLSDLGYLQNERKEFENNFKANMRMCPEYDRLCPEYDRFKSHLVQKVKTLRSLCDHVGKFIRYKSSNKTTEENWMAVFHLKLDQFCFLSGLELLNASQNKEDIIKSLISQEGYSELDLTIRAVKYFHFDCEVKFCELIEHFSKMELLIDNVEFDSVYDVIKEYMRYNCNFKVMEVLLDLTLIPVEGTLKNKKGSPLTVDALCLLRHLFFDHVTSMSHDDTEKLRIYCYRNLSSNDNFTEWSRTIADICGFTLSKLTEIFNRISPNDLQERSETMDFLSRCSFVIPDKIIEKAIHDAFASRGKTMLIQQLFTKFQSLLKFIKIVENQDDVEFVLRSVAKTNITNTNSACQFVRYLAEVPEISVKKVFVCGILPKFEGNKVIAVKLLSSIMPLLENEDLVYASLLDRFFNKFANDNTLNLDDNWIEAFKGLNFEEVSKIGGQSVNRIDYRKLMINKESDKMLALVDFFAQSCSVLPKMDYNTDKLFVVNVPEFVTYSADEMSLCAFRFLTSNFTSLDVRAFAVSLKIVLAQTLFDRKQIDHETKSVNMIVWKTIMKVIKLCLGCESIVYHTSLLDSLPTMVKGILKWVKLEIDQNQDGKFGEFDLFYFCVHMLHDVLDCCVLSLQQKEEIVFRDGFYLLIDQLQLLSRMTHKGLVDENERSGKISSKESISWSQIQQLYNDSVVVTAKRCSYTLPSNLTTFVSNRNSSDTTAADV